MLKQTHYNFALLLMIPMLFDGAKRDESVCGTTEIG